MIRLFLHTQNRQACDLWTLFLKLKKNGTASHASHRHPTLEGKFRAAFEDPEVKKVVKVDSRFVNTLVRFQVDYCRMKTKCDHRSVTQSFVGCGHRGGGSSGLWACIKRMLDTYRGVLTAEQGQRLRDLMPAALVEFSKKGLLSDEWMSQNSICKDLDINGEEFMRKDTATGKSCQRGQALSHEYQRKQNEALKASKLADACRKQADTILKTRLLLDKNTEVEDVLKSQAHSRINPQPQTTSSGQANAYARTYANRKRIGMSDVTDADLRSAVSEKKLKAEGLKAFIVVRKYADVRKGSGYREPTGPLLQSKSHSVPLTEQAVPFLQKPVSMQVTQAQPATPASNRVGSVPTMQISPPQSIFAQPSTAAAQLLADSSFWDGVKLSMRGCSIVVSFPPPVCETIGKIGHWFCLYEWLVSHNDRFLKTHM